MGILYKKYLFELIQVVQINIMPSLRSRHNSTFATNEV